MGRVKKIIKKILPEKMVMILTGIFYGWHGRYSSWDKAMQQCSGYDSPVILRRVMESSLAVKEGRAAYERDSVIFDQIQYSYPMLSCLMIIAACKKGQLNILDFGGSLGSTYYQNRVFLDLLDEVNWCIVEQPSFVKTGQEKFSDVRLHFYNSVDDCLQEHKINVILLSSVIQYIKEPYLLLQKIISAGIDFIIIDRTPFIKSTDRLTVQKVNPKIYKASYPCWFFNKEKFLNEFKSSYNLMFEFDALDKANIPSEFKGFLFKKK